MKVTLLRLLFVVTTLAPGLSPLSGQTYLWLKRQSQVDSFPILYPGQTHVDNLVIGRVDPDTSQSDIHDLTPLSSLQRIYGDLYLRNNLHLKTLHGLHNVDSILTFIVSNIVNNDSLTDLSGLESLKYMIGSFYIGENDRLQNLHGLENLYAVEKLFIYQNPSLKALKGLDNLEVIKTASEVWENAIDTFALPKLRRAGELRIHDESFLTSIKGIANLDSFGYNGLNLSRGLTIYNNPLLASLEGIENAHFDSFSYLQIGGNSSLSNLNELTLVHADTLTGLFVGENPLISEFSLPTLRFARRIYIKDNASLESFNLPNLESVTDYLSNIPQNTITIAGNPQMLGFQMPKLKLVKEGNLLIENNAKLLNLAGMESLETVTKDFFIHKNRKMVDLSGLENLKTIGNNFYSWYQDSLEALCNFTQFQSVGGRLNVSGSLVLSALNGLQSLNYVGKGISFSIDSILIDVSAISNIDSIGWSLEPYESGGIVSYNCPDLTSIQYFGNAFSPRALVGISESESLETVRFTNISEAALIDFRQNPKLVSIEFPSLKKVGPIADTYKRLNIQDNAMLQSLDAFSHIEFMKDSMEVKNNPHLDHCDAICRMMERGIPPHRFKLNSNAFPCNSVLDIQLNICDTLTAVHDAAGQAVAHLTVFPNPAMEYFSLVASGGQPLPATLRLSDSMGRLLLERNVHASGQQFFIGDLPSGVYYVQVPEWKAGGRLAILRQ